jgi:hypothetical protein
MYEVFNFLFSVRKFRKNSKHKRLGDVLLILMRTQGNLAEFCRLMYQIEDFVHTNVGLRKCN